MKYEISYNKFNITDNEEQNGQIIDKISKCIKNLIDNYLNTDKRLDELKCEFLILFPSDACYIHPENKKIIILNSKIIKENNIHHKIAHEIAHAFLNHKSLKDDDKEKYDKQEEQANKLANEWLNKLMNKLIEKKI